MWYVPLAFAAGSVLTVTVTAFDYNHSQEVGVGKKEYNYSREEVLTIGERDIKSSWSRYRVAYEQEKAR